MPLQLEDENKPRNVLDFSRLVIRTKEELDAALAQVPDYKPRMERVRPDDLRIVESGFTFTPTRAELQPRDYPFPHPVAAPMHQIPIDEVGRIDINWRMLTTTRPTCRLDEEIFDRLILLERLTLDTIALENSGRSGVSGRYRRPSRSRSKMSITTDTRNATCIECGEEFCSGTCQEYLYEIHERLPKPDEDEEGKTEQAAPPAPAPEAEPAKKTKTKKKTKTRKSRKRDDNDNEGASRGGASRKAGLSPRPSPRN